MDAKTSKNALLAFPTPTAYTVVRILGVPQGSYSGEGAEAGVGWKSRDHELVIVC